jgi:hemolysin D
LSGAVRAEQFLIGVVVSADRSIEIEMMPNEDIGFVHDGDPAKAKIDTFDFTRYGLLRGGTRSAPAALTSGVPTQRGNRWRRQAWKAPRLANEPPS